MTTSLIVPLDLPTEGVGHEDQALGFLEPLVGFGAFVLIGVLLVMTFFYVQRRGLLPPLTWPSRAAAPELVAKQVLAERFARGDLSSEEFMERASVLNWTPGMQNPTVRRVGRRG